MQDINMIDIKTGYVAFHNVMITKNTAAADLRGVPELLVNPKDDSILAFRKSVTLGKVRARVKINFLKTPVITITPMIGKSGVDMLKYSKMWLRACLPDEIPTSETENAISYEYDWGSIAAQYLPDKEHEQIGGWIEIQYNTQK